ncbi:SH3 domain-containing protein [Psychrobacter sp. I-STPA6b]|uniref:SH3 domain-containing protein n=1 Tax=Psychrobacter sp. I-STPA6b TaxID=2585718 RepID=UPI001D0CCAF9|nr:SH3 domain-containing protein [Psychrobacter sp. I-STPA6b]
MKTYIKIINKKSIAMLMISTLTAVSSQAQAGFLDSLSSVRDSISAIGHTANTITNSKNAVSNLGQEMGIGNQNNQQQAQQNTEVSTQVAVGAILQGKLQKTTLYSAPNKTSTPVAILNKEDVIVYMGQAQDGYYLVQSDFGEGWVSSPIVDVQ